MHTAVLASCDKRGNTQTRPSTHGPFSVPISVACEADPLSPCRQTESATDTSAPAKSSHRTPKSSEITGKTPPPPPPPDSQRPSFSAAPSTRPASAIDRNRHRRRLERSAPLWPARPRGQPRALPYKPYKLYKLATPPYSEPWRMLALACTHLAITTDVREMTSVW